MTPARLARTLERWGGPVGALRAVQRGLAGAVLRERAAPTSCRDASRSRAGGRLAAPATTSPSCSSALDTRLRHWSRRLPDPRRRPRAAERAARRGRRAVGARRGPGSRSSARAPPRRTGSPTRARSAQCSPSRRHRRERARHRDRRRRARGRARRGRASRSVSSPPGSTSCTRVATLRCSNASARSGLARERAGLRRAATARSVPGSQPDHRARSPTSSSWWRRHCAVARGSPPSARSSTGGRSSRCRARVAIRPPRAPTR